MKSGDEVIRKGRYVVREGKIIGEVPGGYEILMSDKSIIYGNEKDFELRYEEEDEVTQEQKDRQLVTQILEDFASLSNGEADHLAGMIVTALKK
jgi:hypothetical protein